MKARQRETDTACRGANAVRGCERVKVMSDSGADVC